MAIIQARLVPTLCARWPNAESLAVGPHRGRSRSTWPLAQFPRLHEAWYLGIMLSFIEDTRYFSIWRDSLPSIQLFLVIRYSRYNFRLTLDRLYILSHLLSFCVELVIPAQG